MHKLEKLNSSIDIIPLQQQQNSGLAMETPGRRPGASGAPPSLAGPVKQPERPRSAAPARPATARPVPVTESLLRDPMIISRVRTYLYENEDKVFIDVAEMAEHLQNKYRDYQGKKRGPFRAMVRRAYDEITENLTRQADSRWQDDDDDIDIEVDTMQSEYVQAYKRQMANRQNGNSSDKELIDISSDDDQPKNLPTFKGSEKESMEVETTQIAKRPHLSPSVEQFRSGISQGPITTEMSKTNRSEKSRKRPREKDTDSPFEPSIKKKPRDVPVTTPTVKFSDIGGNTKVLESIVNLLLHLKHPEVYTSLNISPPRGFLLHGPPGCGKTLLAHAIAGELKLPLLKVAAPELVAGVSGESEQRIRELFDQAVAIAPCILFLDEIDAIVSDRATSQRGMEKRIVSQLLLCLDELGSRDNGNKVLVLGATNRPESIDPALRRAGRFDREVSLGIPDKDARAAILKVHTFNVRLSSEVNLQKIASLTPGFVGADLVALIREAAMVAVNRFLFDLKKNTLVNGKKSVTSANEIIIEEEEIKKPNLEQDISDVIIEDDEPTAKLDATDITEITEKTDSPTADEAAISTTLEESKKLEDSSEAQQSSESATDQLPTTTSSAPAEETKPTEETTATTTTNNDTDVSKITEVIEPSTNASDASPNNATPVVPTTAPTATDAVAIDEEPVNKMQVEEPGRKLADLLSWLHDDPSLTPEQLELIRIKEQDFEIALKTVQPSAKREGFATVPDVTWENIGSLQDIRQELQMTILAPIRYAEQFASLGLTTPSGVLLCGPPGCGKTLLAKAIANEAGINFISVKGPELLNMYVGESEKAVRQCFMRARNSSPCVIFFDELDALCPKRSDGDSSATARVVNQMLTEMDGVEGRKDVFLMAASNRPDIIDRAVLRPGRLDKILYVGLPNPADRLDILRALTKNGTKPKLSAEVNLEEVANEDRCNGLTGADLSALVKEAGNEVLREIINGLNVPAEICPRHIYAAFDKIRPSVQEKDLRHCETLQKLYSVKKSQNTDVPMSLAPPIDTTMEAMET